MFQLCFHTVKDVHNPFRGIILPETAIDTYLRNYNYSYTFLDANNSISLFIVPLSSQIIKKREPSKILEKMLILTPTIRPIHSV